MHKRPLMRFAHGSKVLGLSMLLLPVITLSSHAQTSATASEARARAKAKLQTTVAQYVQDKDRVKARQGFLQARQEDSSYPQPIYNLGLLAEADENWDETIQWFEEFLKLDSNSSVASRARQELTKVRKNRELDKTPEGKRKRQYDDALDTSQRLLSAGLLKEAVAKAAQAERIDPTGWEAFAITASILSRQKLYAEAAAFLQKAFERAPEDRKSALQAALNLCQAKFGSKLESRKSATKPGSQTSRSFLDVDQAAAQSTAAPAEPEFKLAGLEGGRLLRRFVVPLDDDSQAAKTRGLQIVDERIALARVESSGSGMPVRWAGQTGFIDGATIRTSNGAALYAGTEKPPQKLLDAVTKDGWDFTLSQTAIQVRQGKKMRSFSLGGSVDSGRLITVRSNLLIYYVTSSYKTDFFIRTADRVRYWFTTGRDFVAARSDKYGNIVLAHKSKLTVVNRQGHASELFTFKDEAISALEILKTDNAILLSTNNGLLKIPFTKKLYTLILGTGRLESDGERYYWRDTVRDLRFEITGLDGPGLLQDDKQYVRTLLSQAHKLRELGLPAKALQKYLKVLEIMPGDSNAQSLVRTLGQKLSRANQGSTTSQIGSGGDAQ